MSIEYIDCKSIAYDIKTNVMVSLNSNFQRGFPHPCLAFIQVGNNPESNSYVKYKMKDCDEVGITYEIHKFNSSVSHKWIIRLIKDLNKRHDIHGIMVQLPLPHDLEWFRTDILEAIDPHKDVDGLTSTNQGLITNDSTFHLIPCTPLGVMELINSFKKDYIKDELIGKKALVVGRSNLVGKPLAQLLVADNFEVTVCHSKVDHKTILHLMEESDIICLATGKAQFFAPRKLKENALIVDIGTSYSNGMLYGDFNGANIDSSIHYYATPVPGGIGPLTRAGLMYNLSTTYLKKIKGV